MTHPAIKAALDFVEGQIIGYETRLELGGSLSCTEEIIKQSAEQTLAQLRALEGCVVIERGDVPDGLDKAVEKYKDSRWRDMGYLRKCVEAAALLSTKAKG